MGSSGSQPVGARPVRGFRWVDASVGPGETLFVATPVPVATPGPVREGFGAAPASAGAPTVLTINAPTRHSAAVDGAAARRDSAGGASAMSSVRDRPRQPVIPNDRDPMRMPRTSPGPLSPRSLSPRSTGAHRRRMAAAHLRAPGTWPRWRFPAGS